MSWEGKGKKGREGLFCLEGTVCHDGDGMVLRKVLAMIDRNMRRLVSHILFTEREVNLVLSEILTPFSLTQCGTPTCGKVMPKFRSCLFPQLNLFKNILTGMSKSVSSKGIQIQPGWQCRSTFTSYLFSSTVILKSIVPGR